MIIQILSYTLAEVICDLVNQNGFCSVSPEKHFIRFLDKTVTAVAGGHGAFGYLAIC